MPKRQFAQKAKKGQSRDDEAYSILVGDRGFGGTDPSLRRTSWLSWISSGYPDRKLVPVYPVPVYPATSAVSKWLLFRYQTYSIITPDMDIPRALDVLSFVLGIF